MKNKKLLYVLVPAVIFVWGMIIYRIFGSPGNDDTVSFRVQTRSETLPLVMADNFTIANNYRDPFRVEQERPRIASQTGSAAEKKKLAPQPAAAAWPQVVYNGLIRNQQSKKELALVQINGTDNFMHTGERVQDVELLKVFRDSIQVRFGKDKKFIRK